MSVVHPSSRSTLSPHGKVGAWMRRGAVALFAASLACPSFAMAEGTLEKSVRVAEGLYEAVVSPGTDTVYVAAVGKRGADNPELLALDPATLEVKNRISLKGTPAFGIGLNEATHTLYATDTRGGQVVALDLKSGKVVATISHGEKAHVREAVVDAAANRVYVTDVGGRDKPGAIWIIDGATNKLDRVIPNIEKGVAGVALDTANNQLYVTRLGASEIAVIDLANDSVTRTFPSGGEGAINLALDPKSDRLFVTNQKSGDVSVLEATSGKLLKSIKTGDGALGVALDPARNRVFVANRRAGTVSLIDATTYEVIGEFKTGTFPNSIAVDPRSGVAFVTNKANNGPREQPPVEDPNGDTVSRIVP